MQSSVFFLLQHKTERTKENRKTREELKDLRCVCECVRWGWGGEVVAAMEKHTKKPVMIVHVELD